MYKLYVQIYYIYMYIYIFFDENLYNFRIINFIENIIQHDYETYYAFIEIIFVIR